MPRRRVTFEAYQRRAHKTALYPAHLARLFRSATDRRRAAVLYTVLGLSDEAGEAAGKVKRWLRGDDGAARMPDREALSRELGDVLWYVAESCTVLGIRLEDVASENLEKLADRRRRGRIRGRGDER